MKEFFSPVITLYKENPALLFAIVIFYDGLFRLAYVRLFLTH